MSDPTPFERAARTGRGRGIAVERATEMFRALSNPLRVAIVRELARGDRAVHELVETLGVAQPRISEHLAVLRAARLVHSHREGRTVTYYLADAHVAHIVEDAILHAAEGAPVPLADADEPQA